MQAFKAQAPRETHENKFNNKPIHKQTYQQQFNISLNQEHEKAPREARVPPGQDKHTTK